MKVNLSTEKKVIGAVLGVVALLAIFLAFSNANNNDQLVNQTPIQPNPNQQVAQVQTFNIGAFSNDQLGVILGDRDGKTLYTFANDTQANVSTCTGECATNWPPFTVASPDEFVVPPTIASVFSTFQRADGTGYQVSYNGKPLYYYVGDSEAGDANGQGLNNGAWSVVQIQQADPTPSTQPVATGAAGQ